MKLRYLLPFYALLIAVSFCCRKISSEKEEAAKEAKEKNAQSVKAMAMTETDPITGMLELDTATNVISADLYINVPNDDFKFEGNFLPIETDKKFKGVAFRYYDAVNNTRDDGNGTKPLHVTFTFKNDNNWAENDSIRIMSLDEDDQKTFEGLAPYFQARMNFFKNSVTTFSALLLFNDEWNKTHPDNTVSTHEDNDGKTKQHFLPRITRDDSILLLKLKK